MALAFFDCASSLRDNQVQYTMGVNQHVLEANAGMYGDEFLSSNGDATRVARAGRRRGGLQSLPFFRLYFSSPPLDPLSPPPSSEPLSPSLLPLPLHPVILAALAVDASSALLVKGGG